MPHIRAHRCAPWVFHGRARRRRRRGRSRIGAAGGGSGEVGQGGIPELGPRRGGRRGERAVPDQRGPPGDEEGARRPRPRSCSRPCSARARARAVLIAPPTRSPPFPCMWTRASRPAHRRGRGVTAAGRRCLIGEIASQPRPLAGDSIPTSAQPAAARVSAARARGGSPAARGLQHPEPGLWAAQRWRCVRRGRLPGVDRRAGAWHRRRPGRRDPGARRPGRQLSGPPFAATAPGPSEGRGEPARGAARSAPSTSTPATPHRVPAAEIARRLRAAGVAQARGFAINVASFSTTPASRAYGRAVCAARWGAVRHRHRSQRRGPAGGRPTGATRRAARWATGRPATPATAWWTPCCG